MALIQAQHVGWIPSQNKIGEGIVLKACKERDIHTALDTSGHAPWPVLEKAAKIANLILFDIKPINRGMHTRTTGLSNQIILENLKLLHSVKASVRLRLPLIPGITDTWEHLKATAGFLLKLPEFRKIDLLEFHQSREAKYKKLGIKHKMAGATLIDPKKIAAIKQFFEKQGFIVSTGG